jgi:endoglucanase
MNRVEEVVNYALKNNMYVMLNNHWDGGWMQPTYAKQENVNNKLAVIWQQIAVRFRNYDDKLLFAGSNEVMFESDYGTPTKEYYTVQNSFNQTFINAVRATGGRNTYRHLIVQGFNTNIDHAVNFMQIPKDPTPDRMMIEVHYYDPFNFALNEKSTITQWGKNATDPSKTETWANEAWADAQFQKMKTNFLDKGYAVIIGEYGTITRLYLGSKKLNMEHMEYRKYYTEYITRSIVQHGLLPVYWDNGGTGDFGMGLFNRFTGKKEYPEIIKAVMEGAK